MRMSGKTTRLIDLAVQMLFRDGSIMVVPNSIIFSNNNDWQRGLTRADINSAQDLIDEDAAPGNKAQEHFINSLKRRLEIEHRGYFEVKGNKILKKEFYDEN